MGTRPKPWPCSKETWGKPTHDHLRKISGRYSRLALLLVALVPFGQASADTQPYIQNFSPSSGAIGSSVTVNGSGFTDTSQVWVGNGHNAAFNVVDDSTLTLTVPDDGTSGQIAILNPSNASWSGTNFTVTGAGSIGYPQPYVQGFSPLSGTIGSSVTVTGSGFTGASQAWVGNGHSAAFNVVNDSTLTLTVPNDGTSGQIAVLNPSHASWSGSTFTVAATDAPGITGFSPASGAVGTTVTITGSGFIGVTAVAFNGVSASYTVNSSTAISASVPAAATSGTISVSTNLGTGTSSSAFTVSPPLPGITGFSPASGAVGAAVTITGTGFTGVTAVAFNGTATGYTVNSSTSITTSVPASATSGTISVSSNLGTGSSSSVFIVLVPPAPTITGFSPASGAAGTAVTITGTGFTGVTAVAFNGIAAGYTVNSSTSISTSVPAAATSGPISVSSNLGAAASSSTFIVAGSFPQPYIHDFSPASGRVGTVVTVTGSGFTDAGQVWVGGGHNAAFNVVNDNTLTLTVPSDGTTGQIAILNPAHASWSGSNFSVVATAAPTVTGFSPASGAIGTAVTITGTGFTDATAVAFNGASAGYTVNSSTAISTSVPAAATSGTISVSTNSATGTSPTAFAVSLPPPSITGFSPASGAVGTAVTITGTGFTGATAVAFNGIAAGFTVNSATSIGTSVPAAATSGTISVSTDIGTAASSGAFTVPLPPPSIADFSPASGAVNTVVTITGTGFTGVTAVAFSGTSASYIVNSSTSISAIVPASASSGTIAVSTTHGTAASSAGFTVSQSPPGIAGFSPASGALGTAVTITGSGFIGVTAVAFNGISAGYTVNGSTSISAIVPASATNGILSVSTNIGTASSSTAFIVSGQPASGIYIVGWDPVEEPRLIGYRVYYSTSVPLTTANALGSLPVLVPTQTSLALAAASVPGLVTGMTLYVAATSVGMDPLLGLVESELSSSASVLCCR